MSFERSLENSERKRRELKTASRKHSKAIESTKHRWQTETIQFATREAELEQSVSKLWGQATELRSQSTALSEEKEALRHENAGLQMENKTLQEAQNGLSRQDEDLIGQNAQLHNQVKAQEAEPKSLEFCIGGQKLTGRELAEACSALTTGLQKSDGWRKTWEKEGKKLLAFRAKLDGVVATLRGIPTENKFNPTLLKHFIDRVRTNLLVVDSRADS